MAEGGQQQAAQLVGLGERLDFAGLFGELALLDQTGGLRRDHRQHPAVAAGQPTPGHQHPEFFVADLHRGVSGIHRHARLGSHARDRDHPTVHLTHQAHRPLRVRLAHPLQQRVEIGAAQHRRGEQRKQLGLLARPPGFPRPAGGGVHQHGDRHRDPEQDHDGQRRCSVGDGERVTRFGMEVDQQRPGQQSRTAPPAPHRRTTRRRSPRRRRGRISRRGRASDPGGW